MSTRNRSQGTLIEFSVHGVYQQDIIHSVVVLEVSSLAQPATEEDEIRAVEARFLEAGKRLDVIEEEDGTFTAFYGSVAILRNEPNSQSVQGFTESSRIEAARLAWAAFVVSR
jgi:hypothetical protein